MQYVANTDSDKKEMLKAIGVSSFDELLKDIPSELRIPPLNVPNGISEMELISEIKRAGQENSHLDRFACFLGAGVYDHYSPPLVNQLATRSEFITAYTPYQGEASQGTLQTIYEYQSMICLLTGMDAANASMYDGASALAEAVLLALRQTRKKKILISKGVHPESIETVRTHVSNLNAEIHLIDLHMGQTSRDHLESLINDEIACVVVQNPNFYGYLEPYSSWVDMAKKQKALTIASVNPLSLSLLQPPGDAGVDIVVGEGQPLGNAIAYGGPHFGFFAVKKELMRRLPGRIAGKTVDKNGNEAFVLTLQAREQHIRREKATSNICTNHALCALKGLIFLSVLGPSGFKRMGELNIQQSRKAYTELLNLSCVEAYSDNPFFNEFVIKINKNDFDLQKSFDEHKVIGPLHLERFDNNLKNHYLVAVTEQRSNEHIQQLIEAIDKA